MIKSLNEKSENFELIAQPIQDVPLKYFTQLQANDIVFIDSNHVVRSGSEVNYIVLEILPILPKGVLVQFHDIYLLYDYDRDVLRNFTHPNETALVAELGGPSPHLEWWKGNMAAARRPRRPRQSYGWGAFT